MAAARKRLLLVDDEPMVVQVLREHFAGRYDVDTATSAHQAVEMFGQRRPDAVLLDMKMPEVDGLTFLKFLRQVDPGVPVIIVTADSSLETAHACFKLGALGYVPKPFNLMYLDHLAAAAVGRA